MNGSVSVKLRHYPMNTPHRGPTPQMTGLLDRLAGEPDGLEIEIDACSPRCRIPGVLEGKGHAARLRIRERGSGKWLTADRTMREERTLLQHDGAAAETRSPEHAALVAATCLESAGRRPAAPELQLLVEVAERLDAMHLALTSRRGREQPSTRRATRADLLNALLGQTWPTNALRSGIAWALPVAGKNGPDWLSLNSIGPPSVKRGERDEQLYSDETRGLDRLARELLRQSWKQATGRWTRNDSEEVTGVYRSRRAHR